MEGVLFLIAGMAIGVFMGKLFFSKNIEKERLDISLQEIEDIKLALKSKDVEIIDLNKTIASQETALEYKENYIKKQKEDLEEIQKKIKLEFENLANKVLEDRTKKFKEENTSQINSILNPLKENFKDFEKRLKDYYDSENKDRASVKSEINQLCRLNNQLSNDAKNLANALKGDSKVQGDWGELKLESILEKSGLEKNVNFSVQPTIKNEEGKMLRPDVIVDLPEGKNLIIDSKVSLSNYSRFCETDDQETKRKELALHILSIKNHIRDLSSKNYQGLYGINSPDYVLMFIPIEPAFSLALQDQQNIFNEAINKNIVLVTTSTLIATLRTVAFIWKQEDQKNNVEKIVNAGSKLYDKFVSFQKYLSDIGNHMNKAQNAYDSAMSSFSEGRGNLIRKAEDLKKLGVKNTKEIDQKLLNKALE
ncbi:DNA recombination protein RmuC [Ichthyobacterium seriolicida]|uniref:DNA recombination protein RmuC n=1 Tax=Ichthyobacterium seriolicida TaxID=242600 RepID=A0A1J1DWT8_9FLAO|nr:DNA recombination protein RmuC [Ichthyobacterium seriolicida]BAV94322.1 DNA recombination protein RmuC [Ichthyobacterium seriolicida]